MDISTINPSSAIPRSDLKSQEMKRDGHFTPDEIMYNSILDGCTKQRNVSEALRVLEVDWRWRWLRLGKLLQEP